MKGIFLKTVLATLIVLEAFLCSALLPANWQASINKAASHILPKVYDQYTVTHPALDWEIEQFLRGNAAIRVALDALFGVVLLGNTVALVWVWTLNRRARRI